MDALTLQQLADSVEGTIVGDPTILCRRAVPLRDAGPGDITLADDRERGIPVAVAAGANAVVVDAPDDQYALPQLVVRNIHEAFSKIVSHFRPPRISSARGVSSAAHIASTAKIGIGTVVHPGVTIGDDVCIGNDCVLYPGVQILSGCRIGNLVTLFPNVVLYENTIVEDRVLIHAGSVIGAFGFGYHTRQGVHQRAAQLGYVHLEADVELGACVTVDRGTYGATRIGQGTKIDNHVMVAHNCRIGKHNLICSQVGVAGSSVTGDYCVLAGQVGLADHVELGDRVTVGAQAGVMGNIGEAGTYLGSPAMPIREQMHLFAVMRRLPEMQKTLKRLEAMLNASTPRRHDAA